MFWITLALLSALWTSPGRAVVTWDGAGCVYRGSILITCTSADGRHTLALGGPQTDGAFRGQAGDTFTLLRSDGGKETTRLMGRVYLPIVR